MASALDDTDSDVLVPARDSSPLAPKSYVMPEALRGARPALDSTPQPVKTGGSEGTKPTASAPAPSAFGAGAAAAPKSSGNAHDALSVVKHFEGFSDTPYWDVNHWRTGYGSDTVTRADGTVEPVTSMTRITREDAERDLRRRVGLSQQGIAATIGPEAWSKLPPNVQASLTSVAYNYGHLPDNVAHAAASGDAQAIASSIAGLAGANDGVNAKRRMAEAGNILGTFGVSGVEAVRGAQMPAGTGGMLEGRQAGAGDPFVPDNAPFVWGAKAEKTSEKPEEAAADDKTPFSWTAPGAAPIDASKESAYRGLTKGIRGITGKDLAPPDPETGITANQGAGFVSGVGQFFTGAGELLRNSVGGGKAAEATTYLKGIGDENTQKIGEIAPALIPIGGIAGGAVKAAEEAPSALSGLKTVGQTAATGFGLGAAKPTGEADYGKRMVEKAPSALTGLAGGAVAGLAGEVISGVKALAPMWRAATSGEEKTAAEGLRASVLGESAKAAETEERKAGNAELASKFHEDRLAEQNAEMARIEKAQRDLAQREAVRSAKGRDAAQAGNPQAQAELKAQVTAKLRERVRNLEADAKKAGLDEHQARAFAVEQEGKVADAEAAAEKIAQEHAARPGMDAESFGSKIQETAEATYQKYADIRKKESGFAEAVEAAGDAPKVRTNDVLDYIKEQKGKIANQNTKAIFDWIESEAVTEGEGATAKGISLAKADSLRKTLSTAVRTKQMTVANNAAADASEAAHHLGKINGMLTESAKTASPEYGEALAKFRELSRPLDIFERKGALKGVIAEDAMNGEFQMDQGRAVAAVLNKVKGGSPALEKLIQERPDLRDAARMYFNRELFGFEGAARNPTPEQLRAFLKTNEPALRQAGLMDEFATLKAAKESGKQAIEAAKANVKAAQEAAKTSESVNKQVLDKLSETSKLRDKAVARQETTLKGKDAVAPEDVAKSAEAKAKAAEKRLADSAKAAEGKTKETQKTVSDLAGQRARSEAISTANRNFQTKIENTPAKEMVYESKRFADEMVGKGYIDNAQYDKMLKDIRAVEQKYGDTAAAKAHLKKIGAYVLGTIASGYAIKEGIHLRSITP